MIDWPELPANSKILYEHADPDCPQRFVISCHEDKTFELFTVTQWPKKVDAPNLTKQQVLEIANEMIKFAEAEEWQGK